MSIRSRSQCLHSVLTRHHRQIVGALAFGIAAVSWRSISSSELACRGDIRGRAATFQRATAPSHHLAYSLRSLRCRTFATVAGASSSLSSFWSAISTQHAPMGLTPPQQPPSWDHSPEDVTRLTKEFIETNRAVQDKVGALKPEECSFESVGQLINPISYLSLIWFRSSWVPFRS